jgi:hypothetical protein
MHRQLERGSGALSTVAGIGALIAITLGALAGVDAVLRMTSALRVAEGEALRLAMILSEGVGNACDRSSSFVSRCTRSGESIEVVIVLDGVEAGATAGPK